MRFILLFSFVSSLCSAQYRYGIQEYKNISDFQNAIFPFPKENDNVFIESCNAYYNYSSSSINDNSDTIFVIEQKTYSGRWHRVGNDPHVVRLKLDFITTSTTMQPINEFSVQLAEGTYEVVLNAFYNVNATTTGTGWNFQSGTAILSNYSFTSELPATLTSYAINHYINRSQNYTTTQTARTTDNMGKIKARFSVTTAGTIVPNIRSELNGATVTLKAGTYMNVYKIN